MSQVNNITYLPKLRPADWQGVVDPEIDRYLRDLELWAKQVYENLSGITRARSFAVADLPDAGDFDPEQGGAAYLYVSDEAGGATLAFSDGTNWRRVQDRVIVS